MNQFLPRPRIPFRADVPVPATSRPAVIDRADLLCLGALLLAYVAILMVLSANLVWPYWAQNDADQYHLPQVQWFREHGLTFDYASSTATTPAFHWLMASLADATGAPQPLARADLLARIVPGVLTAVTLGVLYAAMRSLGASAGRSALLIAPFFSSSYVWAAAAYPVTEGLAQIGYAAMALAMARPAPSAAAFGFGALVATATRQLFWPAAAAYPLMLLLQAGRDVFRPANLVRIALACGPATLILAVFVAIWGGLSPPEFSHHRAEQTINIGAAVHGVMILGVFGLVFLRLEDFADRRRVAIEIAVCVVLAGLIWLSLPLASSPQEAGGRVYSVVWVLSDHSPMLLDRPVSSLGLVFGGLFMMAVAWRRARKAGEIPGELLLYGCYALAQAGQFLSLQRYVEPAALLFLAMSLARLRRPAPVGDALLALAFAGWFAVSMGRLTGVIGGAG